MARFNLCPNPKLGTNDTGYFGGGARVTGATDLPFATAYQTDGEVITCPRGTVVAGQQYRYSAYVKAVGASTFQVFINWYAGGAYQSASAGPVYNLSAGQTIRVDTGTKTAPSGATQGLLNVVDIDGTMQLTAVLYEKAAGIGTYFDGDSTDADWDGTDENSTSTLTQGDTPGGDADSDSAGVREGWGEPIFFDDFSGGSFGPNWSIYGNGGNTGGNECWPGHVGNGRRCVANATVTDGVARINGEVNGDTTAIQLNGFEQQYGRWEVRMRAYNTGTSGYPWHAVCLLWPSTERWPQDGEYDFQEGDVGDTEFGAFLHYPHNPGAVQQIQITADYAPGTDISDFHNYAIDWQPTGITLYVDGEQVSFSTGGATSTRRAIQAMPSGGLRIQLDDFSGNGDLETANMDIDWVKVWTKDSVATNQEITVNSGISSSVAFGTPRVGFFGFIEPLSIESSVAFGTPTISNLTGGEFLLGRLTVEAAWGADLAADASTWTWADVSGDLRSDPGVSTELGRADESSTSNPANCKFVLNNVSGKYSTGGRSELYPYVRRNTPIRVQVDPGDGVKRTLFFGFADGFTPKWESLAARTPVVEVSASGTLRRLAQGNSPVISTYRRASIADTGVVAYWPFEEGDNAAFAANVRGGTDMTFTGEVNWASNDTFECSDALPELKDGAFAGKVTAYPATGQNQVRWFVRIPDDGLDNGDVIAYVYTSGDLYRWDLVYAAFGTGNLSLYIYNPNGTLFDSVENIGFDMNGNDRRVSIEMYQQGNNVVWSLGVADQNDGTAGYFSETILNKSIGIVTSVELSPLGHCDGMAIGHLTVQNEVTSLFESMPQFRAFVGEGTTSTNGRLRRLANENGLPLTVYGTAFQESLGLVDEMGFQRVNPLLTLLREVETVDGGQLWDGRDNGLSYTTRRYREDGFVDMTLDAAVDGVAEPFEPTDDDQLNRNRASVTRTGGVTSTYEDVDGPLGTRAISVYDTSVDVNNANDSTAIQFAAWIVHLGTVEGYRYPSVTINLRAAPQLAATALGMIPGKRIDVLNLDQQLTGFEEDRIKLLVEGISWEITGQEWFVTFQCSPFSPWGIARIAQETGDTSEFAWRLDTDGSVLSENAAFGATSMKALSVGAAWTSADDDFPLDLNVGGVKVTATDCTAFSTAVLTAPTFGAAGTFLHQNSGASMVIAAPTGIAVDDILLAFVYRETTDIVVSPAGWTELAGRPITGADVSTLWAFWKRAELADAERTNICPNPNCGTNATGWFGSGTRVTSVTGMTRTTAYQSGSTSVTMPRVSVTPGETYTFSCEVKGQGGATTGTVNINWYNGGSFVSSATAQAFTVGNGATTRISSGPQVVPSTGVTDALLTINGIDNTMYVTAVNYEKTAVNSDFFDGNTTYGAWTGTTEVSTSKYYGAYTFTGVSTFAEATIQRYAGCKKTGSPINATQAQQSSGDVTTSPATSLTTTTDQTLLVWAGSSVGAGAWTPPSGFTERVDTSQEISVATVAKAAQGSTGSVSGTGPSGDMCAWLIALEPIPVPLTNEQTFTIEPMPIARTTGMEIKLWDPRPIGL